MTRQTPSIEKLFDDWVDYDIVQYYLACLVGIIKYDDGYEEFRRTKGVFSTKNDLGTAMFHFLEEMVRVGFT
jgi:hypothetical protein